MAIFKCKMCGGNLEVTEGLSVVTCEYCGTNQTISKTRDEVVANLFNRANNLRLKCEFDKAAQIYEKIVEQDDSESEAHWGIVLCKYGIEYVEDPKTLKRIPTCHRTSFEAVTTDADYLAAVDYSDAAQQRIYENEARVIDKIQKDILAIVKNEKPFDVFLCYKETDENGKRTIDSAITNDIYYQLTEEGFKVFYAPITLEDKLGQEYEPYIFAALNSAKVMLVVGTKPDYFDAVWVRNEWSRFLKLMKADRSKLLIPCYRDMDAYELPNEFAHLQAQDMSKIGFINDVVRGIKKIIETNKEPKNIEIITNNELGTNITPLLKRAFIFLEDEEWNRADEFSEQILNLDPENGEAYLIKLLIEYRCKFKDDLKELPNPIEKSKNYSKIMRFGSDSDKEFICFVSKCINERIEQEKEEKRRREQEELAKKRKEQEELEKMRKEQAELKRLLKIKESNNSYDSLKEFETICPHCNKKIPKTSFNNLIYDELGNGEMNCPYCKEVLFFESEYLEFVSGNFENNNSQATKERFEFYGLKCDYCESIITSANFNKLVVDALGNWRIKCPFCGNEAFYKKEYIDEIVKKRRKEGFSKIDLSVFKYNIIQVEAPKSFCLDVEEIKNSLLRLRHEVIYSRMCDEYTWTQEYRYLCYEELQNRIKVAVRHLEDYFFND